MAEISIGGYEMSQKKKQRLVIRTIILVVLIAAVSYALYNNLTKDSRKALKVGDKVPDFVLQDMNGKNIDYPITKARGYS